jgi:hypothetical protein
MDLVLPLNSLGGQSDTQKGRHFARWSLAHAYLLFISALNFRLSDSCCLRNSPFCFLEKLEFRASTMEPDGNSGPEHPYLGCG